MGSDGALVWTENDLKIKEVGIKLQTRQYSTTEELDDILYEGMSALMNTGQVPRAKPTRKALLQIMSGLMKDELLLHTDTNIQISLALCFTELSRISAPARPYLDDTMQKIFPLLMVAIKQLSCEPTDWQPMHVLKYMATAKSCLMFLDHDESGALILEMFQLFLDIIRPDHSPEIFESMQKIMCMVIEAVRENDDDYGDEETEIINKIVNELLYRVKMDNKKLSPMSWKLGKSVLEECATKLQPYLKEAMKSKNLKTDDYAEINISLFRDTSNGNDMIQEETEVLSTHQPDGVEESKSDETLSETLECCTTTSQLNSSNAISINVTSVETVEATNIENGIMNHKRGRKPKCRYDELEWSSSVRTMSQRKVEIGSSSKGKKGFKPKEAQALRDSQNEFPIEEESGRRDPVISQLQEESIAVEKNHHIYDVDYGNDLINTRIQVWWPDDETFYSGTITAFNPIKEEHTVVYDDNEIEYLDLKKETWEPLTCKQSQELQSSLKGKDAAINLSSAKESVMSSEKTAKRKGRGRPPKKDVASSSKRLKGVSSSCLMESAENTARVLINVKEEQETPAINISSEAVMGTDKDVLKTVMTNESLKDQAGPSSSLTPQKLNQGSLEKTAKRRGRPSKNQPASSSKRSKFGSSVKSGEISATAHINVKDEPEILELSEPVMRAVLMNESLQNQSGPSSKITSHTFNKGSLEKTSERKDIPSRKYLASPSKRLNGVRSYSRMKPGEHLANTFIGVKDKPEQETPAINILSEVVMGADKDEPKTMMKDERLKNKTGPSSNLTPERLNEGSLDNTAKRKGRPSKKHASSSIRSKAGSGVQSGEDSTHAFVNLNDEPEQETPATNISPEVVIEDNDAPRTLMKNQAGPSSSLTSQRLNKEILENTAVRRGKPPKKQPASSSNRLEIGRSVKSGEISAAAPINVEDEPELLELSEVVMGAVIMNESLKNQTGPSSRVTSQMLNKESLEKASERKDMPFRKHVASLSKRPKSVGSYSRMKSGEHFAHTFIDVKDKPEEAPAINISSEVVMDVPKTVMNKSLKNQTGPSSSLTSEKLNKGSMENTAKRNVRPAKKQPESSFIRSKAGSSVVSEENSTHAFINVRDEPEVVMVADNDAPRTLMKNQAGSSSSLTFQRFNIEPKGVRSCSRMKSGEHFAHTFIDVKDKPEQETPAINISSEIVMDVPKTVMMNKSLKNQTGPSSSLTSERLNIGSLENTAKRNVRPAKKQPASSFIRSKVGSNVESGENSTHAFINARDEQEKQTPAINISPKFFMVAENDVPGILMKNQVRPSSSLTSQRLNIGNLENMAKRRGGPAKKQPVSSPKRSKTSSVVKSGKNSAHLLIEAKDESEKDTPEWRMANDADKDEQITVMENGPPKSQAESSRQISQRRNRGYNRKLDPFHGFI